MNVIWVLSLKSVWNISPIFANGTTAACCKVLFIFFKKFLQLVEEFGSLSPNSINLFYATGNFPYPVKTSEKQRFSDVFRGYRKLPVASNELTRIFIPEVELSQQTSTYLSHYHNRSLGIKINNHAIIKTSLL